MLRLIRPFTAYLQKKAIFQPTVLPAGFVFAFDAPFEEIFLDTPDGARLNLLRFPTARAPRRFPAPAPPSPAVPRRDF